MNISNFNEVRIYGEPHYKSCQEDSLKDYILKNSYSLQGITNIMFNYTIKMLYKENFLDNFSGQIDILKDHYDEWIEYCDKTALFMGQSFFAYDYLSEKDYEYEINSLKPDIVLLNNTNKKLFVELNDKYHFDCPNLKKKAMFILHEFIKSLIAKEVNANFIVIDTRKKGSGEILEDIKQAFFV